MQQYLSEAREMGVSPEESPRQNNLHLRAVLCRQQERTGEEQHSDERTVPTGLSPASQEHGHSFAPIRLLRLLKIISTHTQKGYAARRVFH